MLIKFDIKFTIIILGILFGPASGLIFTSNGTLKGYVPVLKIPYQEYYPDNSNVGQCSCSGKNVSWNIGVIKDVGSEEGFDFKIMCGWNHNNNLTKNSFRWSTYNSAAEDWTQVIAVYPWSEDCCCTFHSDAGYMLPYYQGTCIGDNMASRKGWNKQGSTQQPHLSLHNLTLVVINTLKDFKKTISNKIPYILNKLHVTPILNVTLEQQEKKNMTRVIQEIKRMIDNTLNSIDDNFNMSFVDTFSYDKNGCGSFSIITPPLLSSIKDINHNPINPNYTNHSQCLNNNITCGLMHKAINDFYYNMKYIVSTDWIINILCDNGDSDCVNNMRYYAEGFCYYNFGDEFKKDTDPTDKVMTDMLCPSDLSNLIGGWSVNYLPYRCDQGWKRECFNSNWADKC